MHKHNLLRPTDRRLCMGYDKSDSRHWHQDIFRLGQGCHRLGKQDPQASVLFALVGEVSELPDDRRLRLRSGSSNQRFQLKPW